MNDDTPHQRALPQDEYSVCLRKLRANPGLVEKESLIDRQDFYGNAESWIVRTLRVDGEETIFLQRNNAEGGTRIVLPPDVTAAITRQHDGINDVMRRRGARKAAATRKVLGIEPGFLKGQQGQAKPGAKKGKGKP
jgi:hypothetical protein